jgi:acyl carrier protein
MIENSVDQQVIEFTANYVKMPVESIHNSTTLDSIGISSAEDRVEYMTGLEENFGLTYEPGDEEGIYTVGEAAVFIEKKLG